jgi:hypothetical protein
MESNVLDHRLPGRLVQPKVMTTMHLRVDQARRLRQLADDRGVSQAHLLRLAVDRLLLQELGEPDLKDL